jgi:hypothetical protein
VRKTSLIQNLAPWLIWTFFFLTLGLIGRHSARIGAETSSPRSLTQTSTIATTAADCRGDALQERGEGSEKK